MKKNLPGPINGTKKPPRPGVYLVTVQNASGQHGACYLWDGKCWLGWVTMFDPPEWDQAEFHNCRVVDWVDPDDAMRALMRARNVKRKATK